MDRTRRSTKPAVRRRRTPVKTPKKKKIRKRMLINVADEEEHRVAIVTEEGLEEYYVERVSDRNYLGNIYKGRIVNLEPSIQAAFVDFGGDRNGFLHSSDVIIPESVKRSMRNRNRGMRRGGRQTRSGVSGDLPPIQRVLKKGQEVLVQITKEAIGSKGPTLTNYLSLPGRYLVLMPYLVRQGVSKKIEDEAVRAKLKTMLNELKPPSNIGVIVRTAAQDRPRTELKRDLDYLLKLWKAVQQRAKTESAPSPLYLESDVVVRSIRDLFTTDIDQIAIDREDAYHKAADFMAAIMPRYRDRIVLHESKTPLFHEYGVEPKIAEIQKKRVNLPSGGSIVIDEAEALVAIDVNSGKYRAGESPENTALKTNLEAADTIARQLRLRDLGGLVVCDFIDMREEKHRRDLERRLRAAMKFDRSRVKMARMSRFGIIEMTRQRLRPSVEATTFVDCPTCSGSGLVKSRESLMVGVFRQVRADAVRRQRGMTVRIEAHPSFAEYLSNMHRKRLVALEEELGQIIKVLPSIRLRVHEVKISFSQS
ncbi:MAG: Rne/Rng family ribonuclease [Planctomycetota bacterium]|nr:MAG: Rne/Rng family ribonuclease [Planctomycetota bacterium]